MSNGGTFQNQIMKAAMQMLLGEQSANANVSGVNIKPDGTVDLKLFDDRPATTGGNQGPAQNVVGTPKVVEEPGFTQEQKSTNFLSSPEAGVLFGRIGQAITANVPQSGLHQLAKVGEELNVASIQQEYIEALRSGRPVTDRKFALLSPAAKQQALQSMLAERQDRRAERQSMRQDAAAAREEQAFAERMTPREQMTGEIGGRLITQQPRIASAAPTITIGAPEKGEGVQERLQWDPSTNSYNIHVGYIYPKTGNGAGKTLPTTGQQAQINRYIIGEFKGQIESALLDDDPTKAKLNAFQNALKGFFAGTNRFENVLSHAPVKFKRSIARAMRQYSKAAGSGGSIDDIFVSRMDALPDDPVVTQEVEESGGWREWIEKKLLSNFGGGVLNQQPIVIPWQ